METVTVSTYCVPGSYGSIYQALALKRAREEGDITYSFDTNVLSSCSFGGSKGAKGSKL